MLSDAIVELRNVWKKYSIRDIFHRSLREDVTDIFRRNKGDLKEGEFWALKNINISLEGGECVGLYGPNGSGKTTILKLISFVTYPTRGEITVKGRVAPLIAVGAGFHPDLTGRENIYMNGTIIGMTLKEIRQRIDEIIEFSELEKFIDMSVKKYSSGMYLKLGFSIAIHSSAEILLIDEILAVSDESFQKKCIKKIKDIRSSKTMVVVSHNRALMEQIVDRIIFLEEGEIQNLPHVINK
jgi:ABC-type polysaccharide/polyol phosphate transport system ATPase subunit